ncbi:hypothetical protein [Oceaniglobus indicus]|uniref:hypothetical protein n=1 Tax=Oceaniglobus indicus TaxID=2047749 RepID=UPI000C1997E6|nr:hypothetical protein [Oceaniglobus indicus]
MSNAIISPSFAARSKLIRRNNRIVARNSDLHIASDGLITRRRRRHFPAMALVRSAVIFAIVLIAAKAVMLASVGPAQYEIGLSALDSGSIFERFGAFVMQSDGVTRFLAANLMPLLG